MKRKPLLRVSRLRTMLFTVSIAGLLFTVQGCASQSTAQPSVTRSQKSPQSTSKSASPTFIHTPRSPVRRVQTGPFYTNVSGANAKNVFLLHLYANGSTAQQLGYRVFAVTQTNGVFTVEYSAIAANRSQLLTDSYAIANDISFSIELNHPLAGISTVDIAGYVNGTKVLDYFTPAQVINEWGANTVSTRYVKSQSWTKTP